LRNQVTLQDSKVVRADLQCRRSDDIKVFGRLSFFCLCSPSYAGGAVAMLGGMSIGYVWMLRLGWTVREHGEAMGLGWHRQSVGWKVLW
jgi:hypothetical protein